MEKKKLLGLRKQLKKKRPDFIRNDCNKKARLGKKWHRPKGITNKMRLNLRGYPKVISSGYRSPVLVRGLTKQGLEPVIISNVSELTKLDPSSQMPILSSRLGQRKKSEIVKKAKEMNIKLQNIRNIEKYLTFVEENMKIRKDKKQAVTKKKEEKAKEAEKKAKEKLAEEEKKKEEEKKLTEAEKAKKEEEEEKKSKQEKEKVLTQRQT